MARQIRHIDFLDHLRGFAVLAVLVLHAFGAAYGYYRFPWGAWHRGLAPDHSAWLLAPVTFGWIGVPVFFVVSGFCIHLSFARRPDWNEFFLRRFFRIYPPYLAALVFFAVLFPATRLDPKKTHDVLQFVSHLLLLHNFGNTTFYGIDGSWWSIAVEAQLYLLYPLLLAVAARIGWKRAALGTALIEVVLRLASISIMGSGSSGDVLTEAPKIFVGGPFFYWFSWSCGAYLAEEYAAGRVLPFSKIPIVMVVAAIFVAEIIKPLSVFTFTLTSLLTVILVAKRLDGSTMIVPNRVSRLFALAGIWSYSLYLIHQPLLDWMALTLRNHLAQPWNFPWVVFFLLLLLGLAIILPLAGLWHRLCELPPIHLGKRLVAHWVPERRAQPN